MRVYLQTGQLVAVINTHGLDLWRFTVEVSVVQGFHLTLLISEPSSHFLSGYGPGEVLALRTWWENTHHNKQRLGEQSSAGSGTTCEQHVYLHSDDPAWLEAVWNIWRLSDQREKLRVWIIRKALTLRDRQTDR